SRRRDAVDDFASTLMPGVADDGAPRFLFAATLSAVKLALGCASKSAISTAEVSLPRRSIVTWPCGVAPLAWATVRAWLKGAAPRREADGIAATRAGAGGVA